MSMVGMIVFLAFGTVDVPKDYMWADGRCLAISEYPELARVIHDGDDWPYGRCGDDGFRIPDLRARGQYGNHIIKVR